MARAQRFVVTVTEKQGLLEVFFLLSWDTTLRQFALTCISIHFDLQYNISWVHHIPKFIEDFIHLSYRLKMVLIILTKFCILIICKSCIIHSAVLVTDDE